MAKTQIKNYVFKPGIGANGNSFPQAYSLISANKSFIQKEATAWIQDQVDAGASGFVGYTYNQAKCERDIGYNVDAYLKDLRYGGNENTYNTIKYYWDQDVAQIDGDRQPEIQTYGFIKTLINTYILQNVEYSASNLEVTQTIDATKTAEAQAITNIDTLLDNTVSVITSGLSSLPTLEPSGVATIKIQGRYDLEDFLLITNTTANEIIYNFSNNETGGSVEFKTDKVSMDENFPKFLQTTDAITKLTLNYDTSLHSSTDELQIFIEKTENGRSVVTTRPYDFGTDSIERMRVATPLSMLDADFEYGLQPTKWAAIATMRGYPSVYEVPGTDTPVLTVVTDASAGTEGVGQSLITVTTISAHGFAEGTPFTIKALEDSVSGASRAEGSFVINSVPTPNTFTYFAKSKVGTVNPTTISTTYTQLRQAGFYTGANIGADPDIAVVTNGFSGTLVTELDVPSGETRIPFDGPSPGIGAPLDEVLNSRIPLGAQVTNIIDQSAGGGTFLTPLISGDYPSGSTEIDVVDATGVVQDLATDLGDGTATYITSLDGNTLAFNNPFSEPVIGNTTVYPGVSGTNDLSIGTGAVFDISRAAGTYTVDNIVDGGQDYKIGDRILISGALLGGQVEVNDLILRVDSLIDTDDAVGSVIVEGTAFDGTGTITGLTPDVNGGTGIGFQVDVEYEDNVFTSVTTTTDAEGAGYVVNDVLRVFGSTFGPLGVNDTNDLDIEITGVDGNGAVTSFTFSGTAPDAQVNYNTPAATYAGAGSGAEYTVQRSGTTYSVIITDGGIDYQAAENITILGTDLGGLSPANDATITIDNVDGAGAITAASISGTARNFATTVGGATEGTPTQQVVGSGLTLTVELSGGTYNVIVTDQGQDYNEGQTFTILGTSLIGQSPANDLTVTVDTVALVDNGVSTVSSSGTAAGGTASYTNILSIVQNPVGTNARFDITRSDSQYAVSINTAGTNYELGNRIVILGTGLGGQSPLNDLILTVTGTTTGAVTSVSSNYTEAVPGNILDLICTVTSTEATTGLISTGSDIVYEALPTLEITFDNSHGLVPGDTFIVTASSDDGVNNHALAAGSFFATEITAVNKLRYQARAAGNIDDVSEPIQGTIYPRPDSFFIHRPYDGGVQLGTGGPQHGAQAIRQSKKYIRYQSGKGIMYTTGALFAPSYDLRSLTADGVEVGSLITVVTDDNDHGVQEGGIVRILGVETPGYNSGSETAVPPVFDYTVESVVDERTFQIRAQRRLGSTDAVLGFGSQMSVVSWHGATVRSGIFDDQNGIFWEFDGTQISVVQRTGARQLAGTIELKVDNNLVTGNNTRFRDQLKAGDRIIIKGMTHVVSHVNSQTELTVTPDWRGVVDITGAKANLIVDKKTKQEDFNLDRLDGTGPSGYDIDIAKMQMIGIQYSWYGAGFIDFMLRGQDGNFIFAHRMRNSNVNTEAFMRSGNLPVRYEVSNEGPPGKLAAAMDDNQTSLVLTDSSFFPDYGTVYIDNEIIIFSGNDKSTNTLTGLTRGATFSNFQAGANRSYTAEPAVSHDDRTGVVLISNTITPLISHWGSAFITDGQFDDDRGYIFSYAETGITVSTTKQTAFMIRLSPSVSNAITGDLGERELLNRAQLLLQGLEVTSDGNDGTNDILGGIVIEGILNPQNYPLNPNDVGWSGLSGVAQGGQPSFAQIASGGSVVWSTGEAATTATATAQANLSAVLDSGTFRSRNTRYISVSAVDYRNTFGSNSLDPVIGLPVTGNSIRSNTTITGGYIDASSNYGYFIISRSSSGTVQSGTSNAWTVSFNTTLDNRNFAYFDKASFEASAAKVGTAVTSGGSVSFPANTLINDIQLNKFGTTEFYEVQFNNSFSGTLTQATGTIEFTFVQPPYAQPGETVFSFIATPGERSMLDLSALKELTNTPLGGRGTYPNGPDVLAINVYKVAGIEAPANIILRWGEAQA